MATQSELKDDFHRMIGPYTSVMNVHIFPAINKFIIDQNYVNITVYLIEITIKEYPPKDIQ